jgi:Aspartyl/Asparaginyl beta-hydroxylase
MNVSGTNEFRLVCEWIEQIPFTDWPQQHRIRAYQPRPAMVNDLSWHDFGATTDALVKYIMHAFAPIYVPYNRMLSVVMPNDSIHRHADEQPEDWLIRVHVPLATNPRAYMKIGFEPGEKVHMQEGVAYLFDTRKLHSVRNEGHTPRIHFMFDVRST